MLAVPSVAHTNRLPRVVLLRFNMRVRITTQILPPWAVQDAIGVIMEIDAAPQDKWRLSRSGDSHFAAEVRLAKLPLGV